MRVTELLRDPPAPPGPFRPGFWRSPLRGPWMTTVLGSLLLLGVTVVAVTGLLSHAAYEPGLGANAIVPAGRDLPLTFTWPTSPAWLYALDQGLHVNVGLVTIPLLLAKLWSVIPRLFAWPPVASAAEGLERLGIALLVGSALFEFATGVVNMQNWYPFSFNFVVAHYYGAIVFIASILLHVAIKLPVMRRAWRERDGLAPLRASLAQTVPEPPDEHGLVAAQPAAPTISRRGLLGLVGVGSATLLVSNVGESIGGPLRGTALLAPRRTSGPGPNGFPVNKTARAARITPAMTGDAWRLRLAAGSRSVVLSRADLLALELRTEELPIACVEGWSTSQHWEGVPLIALARMVGGDRTSHVLVRSLQKSGVLRRATLTRNQYADDRALLALRVNGADLSPDHGYPARIIVPALPGVHTTKWVSDLRFGA
ncbi:molybdopterin-dependent oxidoreductase [Baekduia soli]|uniref:Molybdopterin-dependent oxidoreductase n=2 Tax=Baekduia soli TaxID=496014 RepID=A0A5B8UC56_9ACTN|nr:molybdopterin-dependent oxidoreductase [Baekduia soli]